MKYKFAITESLENTDDLNVVLKIDRAIINSTLWPEAENVNHPVAKNFQ